jgi:hypothetical protein
MPQVVERAIARRLHEIAGNTAAIGELLAPAPQLEHDVLRELFGYAGVVQDVVGRAHDGLVPLAEDRVERRVIALSQPRQQV